MPVHINTSAVAMEPTANIGFNVNLPTDDITAGASGEARTVTIEYFDNVGAAQTLAVTLTPTVPATGRSNEWTMEVTDNATGTSLGTGTLTFNDAPPNAGRARRASPAASPAAGMPRPATSRSTSAAARPSRWRWARPTRRSPTT